MGRTAGTAPRAHYRDGGGIVAPVPHAPRTGIVPPERTNSAPRAGQRLERKVERRGVRGQVFLKRTAKVDDNDGCKKPFPVGYAVIVAPVSSPQPRANAILHCA